MGTIGDYQKQIDTLFNETGGYWSVLSNYIRLTEEVGEVGRIINQTHGDKPIKQQESAGELGGELADVIFAVMVLANQEGVDLDQVTQDAIEKARRRLK